MKTIFSTIALFSAVLFATSCTEDMEYKDSKEMCIRDSFNTDFTGKSRDNRK